MSQPYPTVPAGTAGISTALVSTVDYHTAGEPFRIVTGGVPTLPGTTVADRRVAAAARADHIRRLLVQEPRGHAGMYGCFLTEVGADIAFGGAFYASVSAADLGLRVAREDLPALIEAGRSVQRALNPQRAAEHPGPRLSGIYGVIFHEELPAEGDGLRQRNVTIFGDGQVDRSPCGSGTTFRARVVGSTVEHGRPAVVTEVTGSASRTGLHQFTLGPSDELGTGFSLG